VALARGQHGPVRKVQARSGPGPTLALKVNKYYDYLAKIRTLFFPNKANLIDFQPSVVFLIYLRQILSVSNKNRIVGFAFKMRIE
jgi:hypothetical protein